jgi:hypothetical protein
VALVQDHISWDTEISVHQPILTTAFCRDTARGTAWELRRHNQSGPVEMVLLFRLRQRATGTPERMA